MRNGANTAWILLGEVAEHFGITADAISAVANGGGMGRLLMGNETDAPTTGNKTFDLYFAQDTSRVFIWTGTTWRKFLSLQFGDMLDYEKYCISRKELASVGGAASAGKVLQLDPATGKANVDITGSPEKLCDYLIDVQGLQDGHALVFNAQKQKFVNLPNYELTRADTTYQGGTANAGKLIRVSPNGKLDADITGSANKIDDVNFEAQGVLDGQVLVYNAVRKSFVPGDNGVFSQSDVTTIGEANKLVRVAADGLIHASITGSAQEICSIPVDINNLADGEVLRYHRSTNSFQNELASPVVGSAKSLILYDGSTVLGDYNGSNTVSIDIQNVLNRSSLSNEIAHLMRLTENLYLALDAADLNPGGYDGLSGETFYGTTTDIDTTEVNVLSVIQGDDSIDVDSLDGLVEGSHYILTDGNQTLPVQIKNIFVKNGVNRVVFYSPVSVSFVSSSVKLLRTNCDIGQGEFSGDDVYCVANLIPFVNEATGEVTEMSRAHLVVKHQNVADAEITAEIALRNGAKFVKGEVIGIGDGTLQTVTLENTAGLTFYRFALYFDGVQQTSGFSFSPLLGEVTFTAASGVIVSADYFYDWGAENFVAMTKTGTYPDRRDPERATTQFAYDGTAGSVATIRLKLKRGEGYATNEVVSTGTGKPRGFKLKHQAVSGTVSVSPTPTSKSFNSAQNTAVVTAPVGNAIRISYRWKGNAFSADSFACTFNE